MATPFKTDFTMGASCSNRQNNIVHGNVSKATVKDIRQSVHSVNSEVSEQEYKQYEIVTFALNNIEQEWFKEVVKTFMKSITKLQQRVKRRINVEVSIEYVIQLLLYMFRSRYSKASTSRLSVSFLNSSIQTRQINIFTDSLQGSNCLGLMLRQGSRITHHSSYLPKVKQIALLNNNIYISMIRQLLSKNSNLRFYVDLMENQRQVCRDISHFMKQYIEFTCDKDQQLKIKHYRFDKQKIDSFYEDSKGKKFMDLEQQAIVQLYKNNWDLTQYRCNYYQLMQYLMTISTQQFQDEFQLHKTKDIKTLVQVVSENDFNHLRKLKLKSSIVKHVEWSSIQLIFWNYQLEQVSDDIVVGMLDNVENKLQYIWGKQSFIIVRRVSDNKILKSMIDNHGSNYQHIEGLLEQCSDGELYDVVIRSGHRYERLQSVRVRYLNYYQPYNRNVELVLNHPEDLVSFSLWRVKIINMSQCVNLVNFYSVNNIYTSKDMFTLNNVKRIRSCGDNYQDSNSCLLADLFQRNKLEYVFAYNYRPDENIIGSFTMSVNTENLRFMKIESENAVYDVKLDISDTFPENLSVYDVVTKNNSQTVYGTLQGKPEALARAEARLIHELKKNK